MTSLTTAESAGVTSDDTRADYGRIGEDDRLTAEEMDSLRDQATAYEYLCHLEEAKQWMEYCLQDELPPSVELEDGLRNGVYLGKLAHYFAADVVPLRKIYDQDMKRYEKRGLHFKHTDNINHFFRAMEKVGLPTIFYPETTDIYDRKNMPKTIYCIHALSLYLFKLGLAPQMKDLYGIAKFTEEELSHMGKELDKYGIQMPQFNKIGGILANELSVDEAALHAAVIAINEKLEAGDVTATMEALNNPNAVLTMVDNDNAEEYQNRLLAAKRSKAEAALNKTKDQAQDDERDMYEELLTHTELQGNVKKINSDINLEKLSMALQAEDGKTLLNCLNVLGIANIDPANTSRYIEQLQKDLAVKQESSENLSCKLDKDGVQQGINTANKFALKLEQRNSAVSNINSLLMDSTSPGLVTDELKKPEADFPGIVDGLPVIYHHELSKNRANKGQDLTYEEISESLPILNPLIALNKELNAGDAEAIWNAMQHPALGLERLDEINKMKYCEELMQQTQTREYLATDDIQTSVDKINAEVQEDIARINAVNDVNDALLSNDQDAILSALLNPSLKLTDVNPDNITHYVRLLNKKKASKDKETDDPNAVLWIEEIQECIDVANNETKQALKEASAVTAVNIAFQDEDYEQTQKMLRHTDVALSSVITECAETYHEQLQETRTEKVESGVEDTKWVAHTTRQGDVYYFNTETLNGSWDEPEDYNANTAHLSKDEIQECISMVSAAYDRAQLWKDNEDFIIKLQAIGRMYLANKAFVQRKSFMHHQLPAIILIQACWRGHRQRKKFLERLQYFRDNVEYIIAIQKWGKMWLAKSKYDKRIQYFKDNVKAIIKLQASVRSSKARYDYKTLIGVENPPLPVVQKFVHLLDQRANDFAEEIELQDLKKRVVQCIKANNDMEEALNTMDLKIGLLVKNRITLQDVITHSKNLRKAGKDAAGGDGNKASAGGFKSLDKSNRTRLEAYQHLFYLLQINPTYFGKLLFKITASRSTNFMQEVILSVYNYGSNQREEYLLLKLFRTALQEEIEAKVDKVQEIATGSPLVIKMVVSFNRGAKGQSSLRQILAPQVQEVLKNKSLHINMNPVDIYRAWISEKETETGVASDLPYEVSTESAMEHEEVKKRVEESVAQLKAVTEPFMNAIIGSAEKIPYGLRYIAKCLQNLLKKKFPETTEDEILKMVGNLIYYRYMNPAIAAPDAFDIIDVSAGAVGLNNDQRRNLASIAKVLQFASAGKTFSGDMKHLHSINTFLTEAYKKFKTFFVAVCNVPELEEKYNMDEYSDAVLLVKPVIFIKLKEMLDTHKLLLEHKDEIAPDPSEPLHDMLEEIGEVPDIAAILGDVNGQAQGPDNDQMEKLLQTEISLTLASRVEVKDDDSDMKSLLLRTKRMVIDIVRVQPGENLTAVLNKPATEKQEEQHMANVEKLEEQKRKEEEGKKDEDELMLHTRSLLNENKLPLEDMKKRVKRNLEKLEGQGFVSSKDNYQEIVNMIAKDIRNQRRYRQRRKQELTKLKQNMERLDHKAKFFEEQSDFYNKYIKSCFDSLATKRKKNQKKKKKNASVKYTAAELHRKKIVLEIDGFDTSQFRNMMFEIVQSEEDVGRFKVSGKFLGVNVENVDLVFQDLLQLQYDGVSVMKMFDGKAKVNVNLLIFLLNKKFYGK